MDLSRFAPEPTSTPTEPRPTRSPRWWWARLELSPNTHRSFAQATPATRGWLHLAMAVVVWPVLVVRLFGSTTTGTAQIAVGAFALAMQGMFTASAVTHYRRWSVWTTEVLFRLDHVGIFLAIAGTLTPIGLLGLDGWQRTVVVGLAWVIAVVGTVVVLRPVQTPVGFANTAFISAGAIILPFLGVLVPRIGLGGVALLLTGAATYVAGAILLAYQRPRLSPELFGYHEVWHLLVVLGVLQHAVLIERYLLPIAA